MNSSKKNKLTIKYEEIMKPKNKRANDFLNIKTVDWRNGENFEIFTLFKKIPSGTTSADSCLTSPNA